MASVRADVDTKQSEAGAAGERPRVRRGWRGLLLRPALAVGMAIVVAAIGGYLIAGNNGGGGPEEATVPVVAQQGIGGTLAIGEQSSMLQLHGLQQLTGKQVYQVWVAKGESVRPSSSFIPDANGKAMSAVDGHLTAGTKVMVTREPNAGRTTPSGKVLLSATVQ